MNGLLKIAKKIHVHRHDHDRVDEAFNLAVSGGEHAVKRHKRKKDRKR
jgi:hypothetical protein